METFQNSKKWSKQQGLWYLQIVYVVGPFSGRVNISLARPIPKGLDHQYFGKTDYVHLIVQSVLSWSLTIKCTQI